MVSATSVWYVGAATQRLITAATWAKAIGNPGFTDTSWDVTNGWSQPTSSLTAAQLAFLALDAEFSLGQAYGPRTSFPVNPTVAKDTALSYYQAAQAVAGSGVVTKAVTISDNCCGSPAGVAQAASVAGTGEMFFNIGINATNIRAAWNHWYTDVLSGSSRNDIDPTGSIVFSASLRIVSSTNPGTVTGQLYRFTFQGRTTVTLDPGGRIESDPLGISLAAGDVIAVRTYLSSGTAYAPVQTGGGVRGTRGGTGWIYRNYRFNRTRKCSYSWFARILLRSFKHFGRCR